MRGLSPWVLMRVANLFFYFFFGMGSYMVKDTDIILA